MKKLSLSAISLSVILILSSGSVFAEDPSWVSGTVAIGNVGTAGSLTATTTDNREPLKTRSIATVSVGLSEFC